jgi:hypothetical protein
MTLEKLEARHQKELKDYYIDREKRLNDLLMDQKELISNCTVVNPQTHDLLMNLLQEQRNAWEEIEQDDLNMLKHIHTLERETFLDKQAKREELADLLSRGKDSAKDHGR